MASATGHLSGSSIQAVDIPLGQIEEDPDNARIVFDVKRIEARAESMKAQGQLVPVIVRKVGDKFRLVDGALRFRAAPLAGMKALRCEVRELTGQEASLAAATANLQRENLTEYEEARAFQHLIDVSKGKVKVADLARLRGIAHNTVKSRLGLLKLPETVGKRIGNGFLIGHAQALAGLAKHPALLEAAAKHFDDLAAKSDLPPAHDAAQEVARFLGERGLAREINYSMDYRVRPSVEKRMKDGATVDVALQNGHVRKLYVDVKAFDHAVAEATEHEAGKRAKEVVQQRQLAKASGADKTKAKERRERELHNLAVDEARRLSLAGIVAQLHDDKHVPDALFAVVRELVNNDHFDALSSFRDDSAAAIWKAAAAACGADPDVVGKWYGPEGEDFFDGRTAPKWFTSLKPGRQLALVAAILGAGEIQSHAIDDASDGLVVALSGKKPAEWLAKGRKEAERTLAAADQAKGAGKPSREANVAWQKAHPFYCVHNPTEHRFKTKGELAAHACIAAKKAKSPPAPPVKATKGKAKAKPAKNGKKAVKEAAAVVKARAKLEKGKQAQLVVAVQEFVGGPMPADEVDLLVADALPSEMPAAEPAPDQVAA